MSSCAPKLIGRVCSNGSCGTIVQSAVHPIALKRCGRCRAVWYCSQTCQLAHWPSHKRNCDARTANSEQKVDCETKICKTIGGSSGGVAADEADIKFISDHLPAVMQHHGTGLSKHGRGFLSCAVFKALRQQHPLLVTLMPKPLPADDTIIYKYIPVAQFPAAGISAHNSTWIQAANPNDIFVGVIRPDVPDMGIIRLVNGLTVLAGCQQQPEKLIELLRTCFQRK